MEQDLEKILNETIAIKNNTACLNANTQGLSIASRGDISPNAAGIFVELLAQANQLDPTSNPPIVALESSQKICLINKHGVTGVICKKREK